MTLHTIAGARNTEEFKMVEQQITFRAGGANIFSNDIEAPKARSTPDTPKL